MSRPRLPVIAGLSAGAGTSTLAAALHAVDGGRWTGGPVDVLVCGAGDDLGALPTVPVLVVRAGGPRPVRAGAVVVLPDVAAWHGEDATRTAARLLGLSLQRRPPDLRGYAEALVAVVGALLRSGVLDPVSGPRVPPPPVPPHVAPSGRRPAVDIPRPEPPAPTPRRPARPPTVRPLPAPVPRSAPPQPAALPQPQPAARPEPPRRARRRVVVAVDAGPAQTVPGVRPDPGSAAPPVRPGPVDPPPPAGRPGPEPGLPRLVRSTPAVPVLLHRVAPVRPRLVAGRALRIAPGPTPDPRPAARRLRIASPVTPPAASRATADGPDDDTIDGGTIDAEPVHGRERRTG